MNIDRAKIAYEAREQGKAYKDIGKIFGLSRERARQLVCKWERYLNIDREEKDPFIAALLKIPGTTRTRNCLRNYGYNGNPQEIAESGSSVFIKVKNLGKKSLLIIARVLQEQRYIENSEAWLGPRYMSDTAKREH